jgi:hypothetical protein
MGEAKRGKAMCWSAITTMGGDISRASGDEVARFGSGVCGCYQGGVQRAITAPNVDLARGYRDKGAITVIISVINV